MGQQAGLGRSVGGTSSKDVDGMEPALVIYSDLPV